MACNCNLPIITNSRGIPYFTTQNITVGTTAVDFALGLFRGLPPAGYITIRIANPIPTGTTTTLPVTFTLNGLARNVTLLDGSNATVADITGANIITLFNDRENGILQIISQTN
ncbi:MAG: hypothetical protein II937_05810 [Bacteroidales bacterium]|nr:hypothetical protein [Bacteroidales bacterium]